MDLKDRLTAVLRQEPTTEIELRRLVEEGDAWERILRAQLETSELRLEACTNDDSTGLGEVVDSLRDVREIRTELEQLRALLSELDARARELRASWA